MNWISSPSDNIPTLFMKAYIVTSRREPPQDCQTLPPAQPPTQPPCAAVRQAQSRKCTAPGTAMSRLRQTLLFPSPLFLSGRPPRLLLGPATPALPITRRAGYRSQSMMWVRNGTDALVFSTASCSFLALGPVPSAAPPPPRERLVGRTTMLVCLFAEARQVRSPTRSILWDSPGSP